MVELPWKASPLRLIQCFASTSRVIFQFKRDKAAQFYVRQRSDIRSMPRSKFRILLSLEYLPLGESSYSGIIPLGVVKSLQTKEGDMQSNR